MFGVCVSVSVCVCMREFARLQSSNLSQNRITGGGEWPGSIFHETSPPYRISITSDDLLSFLLLLLLFHLLLLLLLLLGTSTSAPPPSLSLLFPQEFPFPCCLSPLLSLCLLVPLPHSSSSAMLGSGTVWYPW